MSLVTKHRPSRLHFVFVSLFAASACEPLIGADFDGASLRPPSAARDDTLGGYAGDASDAGVGARSGHVMQPDAGRRGSQFDAGESSAGGAGAEGHAPAAGAAGVNEEPAAGAAGSPEPPVADSCSAAPPWQPLGLAPVPEGGLRPSVLATSLGVASIADGSGHCLGALIAPYMVLFGACNVSANDEVVFESRGHHDSPGVPVVTSAHSLGEWQVRGEGFTVGTLRSYVPWDAHPPVPWSARQIFPGERLTFISRGDDGHLRTLAFRAGPLLFFDGDAANEDAVAIAFGEDDKLVGLCRFDPCGTPSSCLPLTSLVRRSLLLSQYEAMYGVFWGDSTGDRAADAVVVSSDSVALRPAEQGLLGETKYWVDHSYFGDRANRLGDVTGDGLLDLLAIGSNVAVRTSTGTAYVDSRWWSADVMRGERFELGDVDGNTTDDLVTLEEGVVRVYRSTGIDFLPPEAWAEVAPGFLDLKLADVDADGRSDLIVIRPNQLDVLLSTAVVFTEAENWLNDLRVLPPGFLFGDVTGDGAADAVRIDAEGAEVFASNGVAFARLEPVWSFALPLGERGNYLADVSGDGKADAVVHDHHRTVVYDSLGDRWSAPRVLITGAFFGGL